MRRLRRTSAEGLEAYERMMLDHVAELAVDGIVPAEALTTGPQDQSTRWWRAFRQAVVADARERGLVRDRWSAPVKAFLRAAALVPAGLGVLDANAAGVLADRGIEVDPARVVTAEDAALALGEPVGPARPLIQQPSPVGRMRGCRYQAASGRGSVSVFTAAGDLVGLLVRGQPALRRPGPGCRRRGFLRGDTIVVIKGDVAASIRVQGDQVPDRVAVLRRLASTVAPPPDGGRAGLRSPAPPGTSPGPS